jgi:hypothetical protein
MLLDYLDGIRNSCRTKVRLGVVEAINANIKTLFRKAGATRISPICCSKPGGHQDRIHGSSEGSLKCRALEFLCSGESTVA